MYPTFLDVFFYFLIIFLFFLVSRIPGRHPHLIKEAGSRLHKLCAARRTGPRLGEMCLDCGGRPYLPSPTERGRGNTTDGGKPATSTAHGASLAMALSFHGSCSAHDGHRQEGRPKHATRPVRNQPELAILCWPCLACPVANMHSLLLKV